MKSKYAVKGMVLEIKAKKALAAGMKKWRGLKVVVTSEPIASEEFGPTIFVSPLTERPDGFKLAEFLWDLSDLRRPTIIGHKEIRTLCHISADRP